MMFDITKRFPNLDSYKAITSKQPNSVVSEQYRKLKTNIELSDFNKTMQTIALTSTFSGEGKTISSINLATVYSQSEFKTLLIDLDLRKPKIHRGFNIVNENGLGDIAQETISSGEAVQQVNEYLYVLPAGSRLPFPVEFLMSTKFTKILEELKGKFDKIIIDTPPMGAVSDASIISKVVDGTILVIASRKTNADVAKDIVKDLQTNGANILGTVLTRVHKKDHRYLSYYYEE